MGAHADPVKTALAAEVKAFVESLERKGLPLVGGEEVTVHKAGFLETQVKVRTTEGVRYFLVKVQEKY